MKKRNYLVVLGVLCLGALTGCGSGVEGSVKTYGDSDALLEAQKEMTSPNPTYVESSTPPSLDPQGNESGNDVENKDGNKPGKKPEDVNVDKKDLEVTKNSKVKAKAEHSKVETLGGANSTKTKIRVSGVTSDETEVWFFETVEFPSTVETAPLNYMGDAYGITYVCYNGVIFAIDIATGNISWVNKEFSGDTGENVNCHLPRPDGHLYVSGYYGPDFMEIDENGKTVKRIDHLLGDEYYWPLSMEITQDEKGLLLYYQSNAKYALLNLEDYSAKKFDNN